MIFGVDLEEIYERDGLEYPIIIDSAISHISENGFDLTLFNLILCFY